MLMWNFHAHSSYVSMYAELTFLVLHFISVLICGNWYYIRFQFAVISVTRFLLTTWSSLDYRERKGLLRLSNTSKAVSLGEIRPQKSYIQLTSRNVFCSFKIPKSKQGAFYKGSPVIEDNHRALRRQYWFDCIWPHWECFWGWDEVMFEYLCARASDVWVLKKAFAFQVVSTKYISAYKYYYRNLYSVYVAYLIGGSA